MASKVGYKFPDHFSTAFTNKFGLAREWFVAETAQFITDYWLLINDYCLSLRNECPVKILIVDDEDLDLFITKKLLSVEFQTEGFTAIGDALNWAKINTFDVALIDYYLGPGLNANNVLKEIYKLGRSGFKAYVLSNYVDDKQILELRNAGFNDIIYKPLTLESFKKKLNSPLTD